MQGVDPWQASSSTWRWEALERQADAVLFVPIAAVTVAA